MPQSQSSSVGKQLEVKTLEAATTSPVLDSQTQEQLSFITTRAISSLNQMQTKLHELNNLDFFTDDKHNRDIRNSFIRPKNNDDEIRINTGTVEKKMISVVNEILSLNLTPEVETYDEENKPIADLGDTFTNLLKSTNEQENGDDLDFPILWDLATRRITYVEEYQEVKTVVDKRKKKYNLETGEIEFETKEYTTSLPKKRIRDPRSILLGNFSLPNHRFNEQPYIIAYDRKHWREAYSLFSKFKNWKFVRPGGALPSSAWYGGQFDFRLFPELQDEEVEILTYYSLPDDEYQIIVNGAPLLPPNCPLPWEHKEYMIQGFVSREMEQNLAIGQLYTINARVLASVSDEMLRLLLRKWKQSIEPPVVLKGKKVISKDIWNPGAQASGIAKDDIQKLIDNPGITQSEMATLEMMGNKIEAELGVAKIFQGLTDRKLTATQSLEQMKQAIKALGLLVLAWTKVKRKMAYLRIYNIIENNTEPVGIESRDGQLKNIYKYFTINNTKLDNNTNGTMVVQFSDEDMTEDQMKEMKDFEDEQASKGNYVRYRQINVKKLREFRLNWFVTVIPKEKDSSVLQKITFTDELNQVKAISDITGRRINSETIVNEYERIYKKKNMFEQMPTSAPNTDINIGQSAIPAGAAEVAGTAGPGGPEIDAQISSAIKREGVNSAVPTLV